MGRRSKGSAGKGGADLVTGDRSRLPRLEVAKIEVAQPDSLERRDVVSNRLEQPPHFAVPALTQLERQVRFASRCLSKRRRVRAEPCAPGPHTNYQLGNVRRLHPPVNRNDVDSRNGVSGIRDPVGKAGIGCQEEQAGRRQVQAADRDEASRVFPERVVYGFAVVGIVPGGDNASRLVEKDKGKTAGVYRRSASFVSMAERTEPPSRY